MAERVTLDYTNTPPRTHWAGRIAVALMLYPALLVGAPYATWLVAWAILGHRPVAFLNDPADISVAVDVARLAFLLLLVLAPVGLGAHVVTGVVWLAVSPGEKRVWQRGAAVATLAAALWAAAYVLLTWDPGDVGAWFMDKF